MSENTHDTPASPPMERPKTLLVETGWVGAPPAIASAGRAKRCGVCGTCGKPIHEVEVGRWSHILKADDDAHPEWTWTAEDQGEIDALAMGALIATRPVFDPTPRKCPHCGHVGVPDQECSHDTCQNCGLDVDEPPTVEPFGHCSGCGVTFTEAGGLAGNLCVRCARQPYWIKAVEVGPPGTDMRTVRPGERIEEGDWVYLGERTQVRYAKVPSGIVGQEAMADSLNPIFRGVPLGEPAGPEGPAGEPRHLPPMGAEWRPTPPNTACAACGELIVNEACRCGIRGPNGPGPHPDGAPVRTKPPAWLVEHGVLEVVGPARPGEGKPFEYRAVERPTPKRRRED